MSSIIHKSFITREKDGSVTIDANAIMLEKYGIPRDASTKEGLDNEGQDSFEAGIEAKVLEVEEPEPVSLEETREEAKEILDQAREQADQMLNEAYQKIKTDEIEAKKQADVLYEQSKNSGYADGLEQARAEFAEKEAALETDYNSKVDQLEADYSARQMTMESDIVDAIVKVFERVFNIQFEDKKDILLYLVTNTIMNIDAGKELRIKVSEADLSFMESKADELIQKVGNAVSIDITMDGRLSSGDCVIETDYGVFNCGVDEELNGLLKDIKSLCL